MSAEHLVAAAAAATGPIQDGDLAGWAEQVRRASSAAVIIAADMERLLEALADPELKMHVRKVSGVSQEKGRFIITYTPSIDVTFKGVTNSYTDFRTGWVEEPHARQIARTARESIGRQCIFFQLNEHSEGDAEAPASGYRRLIHLEPVPGGQSAPSGSRVADAPTERSPTPQARESERSAPPAPAPEPERQPAPEAPPVAAEPAAQPALAEAEPPPPVVDQRPVDPSFLALVAGQLTAEEIADLNAPLRKEVLDTYKLEWWNKLGSGRAAILRQVNAAAKAAGRPHLRSIHAPETTGDLRTVGNLTRDLLEREGAPA